MKRVLQFIVLFCAVAVPARAQMKTYGDGTTASVKAEHLTVELFPSPVIFMPVEANTIALHFVLERGWHVYWSNAGDAGEPPRIEWTLPKGVIAGPLLFPVPSRLPLGPLMDFGYEGDVVLPLKVQVPPGVRMGRLQAKVDWLVCREVCLPGKALLGLQYRVAPAGGELTSSLFEPMWSALHRLPQPLPSSAIVHVSASKSEFVIALNTGTRIDHAEFYPFDQGLIANAAPQVVEPTSDGVRIHVRKDDTLRQDPAQLHGLIKISDTLAYDVTAPISIAPVSTHGAGDVTLLAAIGLAFLGGIILNLMPCVFPVLFLKGLALVQGAGPENGSEQSRTKKHGLVYTLGILVSFWAIVGVLLALRASGAKLGWGFQLQSPVFVAVLCLGIFFFALSLAGVFDFGLSLTSAGGELAQKSGYTGSFFTGVLATVVATPCTAPLMGAAIGFALSQSAWMAFVVFTTVALGLALPYLLLSFNPGWTKFLPRPGAWMEVLKQVTSIPLFATAIWLAWVYGALRDIDAMALLLFGMLVIAIAAWVMGRWPAKFISSLMALALAAIALAIPLAHREDTSLTWTAYSPDALSAARAAGKPVFVDFTAAWCLSCHVNEAAVLDSADVQAKFKSTGIVLMRADWTKYDPAITAELASVGRSGVPTYVIYPRSDGPANGATPDVLPELLSKGVVLDALARDVK